MLAGFASLSLNTLSITESSVDVVSIPQNDAQSFTTIPAAMTSLPLLTVPAYTRNIIDNVNSIQYELFNF